MKAGVPCIPQSSSPASIFSVARRAPRRFAPPPYKGVRRRARIAGASETWYNWDKGWTVISEEAGSSGTGALTRTYVGRSLAHVDGSNPATGTWRYMYHDHLGSVRQVRDANRNLVAQYAFLPYGQMDAWSGTANATTHLFTGHDRDPLTGQDYAPYRWYSSTMNRWISRDPLGMVDGSNVYAYVRGNPILRYDSKGLFSVEGCCGAEKSNIDKQVKAACSNLDKTITDESLRKCIKKRCENSKIVCTTDKCEKENTLGYNEYKEIDGVRVQSEIAHLCINNIIKLGYTHRYGEIAIHEWAHSCGWRHDQGKGVPGNSGVTPR